MIPASAIHALLHHAHLIRALAGVAVLLYLSSLPLRAFAQTGPRSINISGGLFKPNGTPILNANVNFKIEVRDKAGLCVLYSETHSAQDLSDTNGAFSLLLGSGSSPANKISGTTALDVNVFNNPGVVAPFTDCPSGLTLNAGDERVIRVFYDIGSGMTAMNPDVPVVSSAYAMVAETLQGKTPDDFLNVQGTASSNLQQTNVEYAFSLTNWQRLKDLIDGVSSQYLPTAGTGAFDFGNRVITGVSTPGTTADAVNKGYADSFIGGKATDLTSVGAGFGNGQTLVWDQVQNKWVTGAATDATKLPLVGGTMAGNINMGGYDLLNVGNIIQGLQKTHTLGRFTSVEEATLVATLGTGSIGMSWYNTDLKAYKIWDGVNAITQASLSSVGTSPGTLNPSWFPASGVSAGTYGGATSVPVFTVGADGRLTVAYGTTISGVAPGGLAGGDLTGSYPNPSIAPLAVTTAKLDDNAITAAKINSTGVAINRLVATDPVTPNTLTYFECPINDQIMTWTANGWDCTTVAALSPVKTVAGRTPDALGNVPLTAYDIAGIESAATKDYGTAAGDLVELDGSGKIPASMLPAGTGTISAVTAVAPLQGGGVSGNVTVSIDVGTGANQVVRLNGSAQIPAVDGSLLTGVNASKIATRAVSSDTPGVSQVLAWNGSQWEPTSTAVGSMTGIVSGVGLVAGTITSFGTIAVDVGTAPNQLAQFDGGARYPPNDGSLITNVNAVRLQSQLVSSTAPSANQILKWNGSQWEPSTDTGTGTVTSVVSGAGLVAGTITTGGTIAVDVGTGANQVVQLNGSSQIPAVDGSLLTGVNASKIGTRAVTSTAPTPNQVLAWNGSQWEPTTAATGSVTSVISGAGLVAGTITGAGTVAVDVGTGADKIVQFDGSARYPANDGSLITNVNAVRLQSQLVSATAPTANQILKWNGSQWEPSTDTGTGTVTSIVSGAGLIAGTITNNGTIAVDVGTGANQVVQLNGSSQIPAVDGSLLTGVNASKIGTRAVTSTAPSTNQVLGWNGSQWEPMAASSSLTWPLTASPGTTLASAPSYSFASDTDTGFYSPGVGTASLATNGTARLTIDSSGRVGVGTASPVGTLQVVDGADPALVVGPSTLTNANATLSLQGKASGVVYEALLTANWAGELQLKGAAGVSVYSPIGNPLMTVVNSGNVGIGTTNPGSAALEVVGTGANNSAILVPRLTTALRPAGANGMIRYNTNTNKFEFFENNAWVNYGTGASGSTSFPLLASPGVTSPSAPSYSFAGDSSTGFYSPGVGTASLATAGTARMTISSSGYVGIGTTDPYAKFDVSSNYYDGVALGDLSDVAGMGTPRGYVGFNFRKVDYSSNYKVIGDGSRTGGSAIYSDSYGNMNFTSYYAGFNAVANLNPTDVANGRKMVILSSGNVGIGTVTPGSASLEIAGTGTTNSAILIPRATTANRPAGANGMIRYNTNTNKFEFFENSAWVNYGTGSGSTSFPLLASPGTTPASAPSYSFSSDADTGLFSPGPGTAAIATNGTARMIIDDYGSLIVTTGDIINNSGYFQSMNGSAAYPAFTLGGGPTGTGIFRPGTGGLAFAVTTGERMRIETDGNVGIGTTTPGSAALNVEGTTAFNSAIVVPRATTAARPGTAVNGMVRYNTNTNAFEFFQNAQWVNYSTGGGGSVTFPLQASPGTTPASAPSYSFASDTDTGFFSTGAGTASFATNGTARMTIDSAGNVGIGTAAPDDKLKINSSATGLTGVSIYASHASGAAAFQLYGADASGTFGAYPSTYGNATLNDRVALITNADASGIVISAPFATQDIRFSQNNTERMRIDSTGNIGIGTTSPGSAALEVAGTGANNSAILIPRNTTALRPAGANGMIRYNTNTSKFEFFESGSWVNYGTGSGSTSTFTQYTWDSNTYSGTGTGDEGVPMGAKNSFFNTNNLTSSIALLQFGARNTAGNYQNAYMGAVSVASGETPAIVFGQSQTVNPSSSYAERMRIHSTGNVGIGTTSPGSAALEVAGTGANNSAILIPRNTTALRPAGANGMLRYNTNSNKFEFFENGSWVNYGTGSGGASFPLQASPGTTPASAPSYSFASDSDTGFFSTGAGTAAFATNGTSRMTIDSSGNVGIGLSSPSYVFDIRTTGNSYATLNAANYDSGGGAGALFQAQSDAGSMFFKQFSTAGGGAGQIRTNGTSLLFQASAASGYMVFETGGSSERMRITSAGNVGIGTTNPGHPLDVNGIVRATSFISTSDGRLKRNIRQVEGLEALTKLNGVRYEWKSNGKSEIGLIAQDVEEIFPEVVVTDEQGFKAVKYQNLIAPIIESTKELYGMCKANTQAIGQTKRELASVQEEIRQLKDENSQLRNQVQDLNKRFEALEKSLNSRKVD